MLIIKTKEELLSYLNKDNNIIEFNKNVEIDFECIDFDKSIFAKFNLKFNFVFFTAGRIEAGGWIKAGSSIKSGSWIEAGRWIKSEGFIEAGDWIKSGGWIRAAGFIESGDWIKAEGFIEAGDWIKAGSWIFSFVFDIQFPHKTKLKTSSLPFFRKFYSEIFVEFKSTIENNSFCFEKIKEEILKLKSKEELKLIIDNSNQHWIIKVQLLMFFGIIEEYVKK